jgi:large subunit ribosomal protein L9
VKLVLTQDVAKLGESGAVVEVAAGYARNFLLPRGLAVPATPEAERRIQAAKKRRAAAAVREQKSLAELAATLHGRAVHIRVRVNEQGRLFGSVGAAEIALALREEHGVTVEAPQILLPEPFKTPDVYTVKLRFAPEAESEIKVWVLEESEKKAEE